jgi:NADH-quinone oxidoreductase subunit G
VDICPVGALTSKDFRFQMRVWFLKETKSICTGCATGCNTIIGSRESTVYRQTPRENEAVNSEWMCDQGRLGFHYIHSEKRLTAPIARRGPENSIASWGEIIPQVAERLKQFTADQIGIVASGRLTNEEAFLVAEIRRVLGGDSVITDLVPRVGEADGFLRSADLNPNTKGVTLMGLSKEGRSMASLQSAIDAGKIRALVVLHEDLVTDAGWSGDTLQKLDLLVYVGLLQNATSDRADFILPGASFAEKRGSMINAAGRLQRLNRAIASPGQALDDWQILIRLKEALGGGNGLHTIEDIFKAMAAKVPAFAGLTMSRIGDLGSPLETPAAVVNKG